MFGVSFFGCYFKMQDVLEGKEELADNSRWTKKTHIKRGYRKRESILS